MEAVDVFEKTAKNWDSPLAIGVLGAGYATSGQTEKAVTMLRELKEQSKQRYVPNTSIAFIYAALGETERALEFLEEAYKERDHFLFTYNFKIIPGLDKLQSDPKLIALQKRIGLS
jgi:hypothetical protein